MAFKVVWTNNAEDDLRSILDYLLDEWADSFAEIFSEQLFQTLNLLETHPYLGAVTEDFTSIRRIAINKQYSLYYLVLKDEIVVANILNNSRKK
jgi:plasmid stabilization system protein ParE